MTTITTPSYSYTVEARRVYIQLPLGSLLKARVKSAGAHRGPDRIAWWIGTTNPRVLKERGGTEPPGGGRHYE